MWNGICTLKHVLVLQFAVTKLTKPNIIFQQFSSNRINTNREHGNREHQLHNNSTKLKNSNFNFILAINQKHFRNNNPICRGSQSHLRICVGSLLFDSPMKIDTDNSSLDTNNLTLSFYLPPLSSLFSFMLLSIRPLLFSCDTRLLCEFIGNYRGNW